MYDIVCLKIFLLLHQLTLENRLDKFWSTQELVHYDYHLANR